MRDVTKFNREFSETALKKAAALGEPQICSKCGDSVAQGTGHYENDKTVCDNCTYSKSAEIEADLKDFSIVDNGSHLSVSHKALNDSVIGIVSKNEYEKGNKEAILRSVLENKCAEFVNTHSFKITGSFVAPMINPAPKEEIIVIEKKASQEKQIEPAKEITSDLPLLRSADSFRQNVETVAFRSQDKLNRFVASATNGLVEHLRGMRYDMPKVNEVDASALTENSDFFNGHIVASVSLESATGPKYLNLPITISASKIVYPNEKETADFVSKGIDLRSKLEESLALEALTAMAKVDAEEEWTKENISSILSERTTEITKVASDYTDGISSTNPGAHIKMQKHLLPGELADWEVGSTIYSDGKHWKLVSKGDGIDSNDKNAGSASLWDFVECLPEEASKETKADIPR